MRYQYKKAGTMLNESIMRECDKQILKEVYC